jgi:2-polyprenyl-3-methyl-5-hydroxy-6-metoxy-1,4-benzoquinol methylase
MTSASPSCPICGGAGPKEPFLRIQHILYRCGTCDLIYSERVADPDLARYYRDGEDGFFDRPYFDAVAETRRHPEYRNYRAALEKIKKTGDVPPRLLDVGCGAGFLLKVARELKFESEGLEVSSEIVKRGGGDFKIHSFEGNFENIPSMRPFDVIVLWDVLEHLAKPVQALERLKSVLRPGGCFLLRTINEDCLLSQASVMLARLGLPAAARRMHEIYHVIYFNSKTLEQCLTRSGLKVRERWKGEFPVERISRSAFVKTALRTAYLFQAATGRTYEQYVITRPGD